MSHKVKAMKIGIVNMIPARMRTAESLMNGVMSSWLLNHNSDPELPDETLFKVDMLTKPSMILGNYTRCLGHSNPQY
jgi:hypothetical protein